MGMKDICTCHMFGVWEESAHLSGILVSISTSIVPQSLGCFLLDWILPDVCYASCCCTFLCSFIMSQVSTTTAMTTTPPVTVMSSGMSPLSLVTMAPYLMGLPATLGKHDVVLPPLTPRALQFYWPCLCATAATSISDASSGLCQLCHGSSTGKFPFQN